MLDKQKYIIKDGCYVIDDRNYLVGTTAYAEEVLSDLDGFAPWVYENSTLLSDVWITNSKGSLKSISGFQGLINTPSFTVHTGLLGFPPKEVLENLVLDGDSYFYFDYGRVTHLTHDNAWRIRIDNDMDIIIPDSDVNDDGKIKQERIDVIYNTLPISSYDIVDAVKDCAMLKLVRIGDCGGITGWGDDTFEDFVQPVNKIDNSFKNCPALFQVLLADPVEQIVGGSFSDCPQLRMIFIPKTVKQISSDCFSNCPNLTEIFYEGDAEGFPWGATNAVKKPLSEMPYMEYDDELELYSPLELTVKPSGDLEGLFIDNTKKLNKEILSDVNHDVSWIAINRDKCSISSDCFEDFPNLTTIYYEGGTDGKPWGAPYIEVKPLSEIPKIPGYNVQAIYGDKLSRLARNKIPSDITIKWIAIPSSISAIDEDCFTDHPELKVIFCDNPHICPESNAVILPFMYYPENWDYTTDDLRQQQGTSYTYTKTSEYRSDSYAPRLRKMNIDAYTKLECILIHPSITEIDLNAFSGCDNLKEIFYQGTAKGFPWGAVHPDVHLCRYDDDPVYDPNYVVSNNVYYCKLWIRSHPELGIRLRDKGVVGITYPSAEAPDYHIKQDADYYPELMWISIPSNVASIEPNCFEENTKLKQVYCDKTFDWDACGLHDVKILPYGDRPITDYIKTSPRTSSKNKNGKQIGLPYNSTLRLDDQAYLSICGDVAESVLIPPYYMEIDENYFANCPNLKTIYYDGIAEGFPWGATNAELKPYPTENSYYKTFIDYITNLQPDATRLSVCQPVTRLYPEWFRQFPNIEVLFLPSTVKEIPENCFINNPNLKYILYSGPCEINSSHYGDLDVVLLKGPTDNIKSGNFLWASSPQTNVGKISFTRPLTSYDPDTFHNYQGANYPDLTTVVMSPEITHIDANAFTNNEKLQYIYYVGDTTDAPWGAPNATVFKHYNVSINQWPINRDIDEFKYLTYRKGTHEDVIGVSLVYKYSLSKDSYKCYPNLQYVRLNRNDGELPESLFSENPKLKWIFTKRTDVDCAKLGAPNAVVLPFEDCPLTSDLSGGFTFREEAIMRDDEVLTLLYGNHKKLNRFWFFTYPNLKKVVLRPDASLTSDTFADCSNLETIVYEGDTSGFPWGCPNSEVKISNDIEDLDDYDKRMYQSAVAKYNEEKNNTTSEN